MGSLLYAINVVLPLVLLVALGYFLKKIKLLNDEFVKVANKLVFYVAIPVLLFKSVYDADFSSLDGTYILYIILVSLALFILVFIAFSLIYRKSGKVGTLVNAFIRANYTLIGIPLVVMMFDSGTELYKTTVGLVSIVAAFALPLFNSLGVIALAIAEGAEKKQSLGVALKNTLIKLIKNPLIIGLLIGLFFSVGRIVLGIEIHFIEVKIPFLYRTISYISQLASPLALIMVGAKFTFAKSKSLGKYIIGGVIARNILMPLVVFGFALLCFDFTNCEMAVLFAAFASPTAVSSVPVAEQMGGDGELAGQLTVYSTLVSPFIIVILITILKSLAIL